MNQNQSIYCAFKSLWTHINKRRRRQFALLLILMILTSFAEMLGIGAILPFLAVLTAPDRVFDNAIAKPIIDILGLTKPNQLILPITIGFAIAALTAGAMRLFLLWANTRLAFSTGADLSIDIYKRTLYQPYIVHCSRNSSEVISGISTKANSVIDSIILPTLGLISSIIMLLAILGVLLTIEPLIALIAFGGFGLIYAFIIGLTRRQLFVDSQTIARESTNVIKSLQEGLGGVRDVLIDGSQNTFCEIYRHADLRLRKAQGNNLFKRISPRYVMEALGMILIAALAFSLSRRVDGIAKAIPILGALALGAQRLLPVLQQAYGSWSEINSGQASLRDTIKLLDQSPIEYLESFNLVKSLSFNQTIALKQLDFRYSLNTPYVLENINLVINKASRVGFIGATGSGKSTLLDIIMGLLEPTSGLMEIDGIPINRKNNRAWQDHIAHVPQAIFLADASIEENIAFGIPKEKINLERVMYSAEQAKISEIIESWPNKYQTLVGERGIRLSGGQRQRIGIARALYREADLIIFDEATSALDSVTEREVMCAIEELGENLTVLIIAHRLTTLENCTQIVEMGSKGILRIGSYHDIVNSRL